MLDTAGRLAIDDALMQEVTSVRDIARPHEVLLVADAMTGQDAVTVARGFNDRVGITGIVLTRVDGDARGGAALSMCAITGRPIKLMGVGEKVDALEPFYPERVAGRILDMGDVVGLVERAAETFDQEEAAKLAAKVEKGRFDLDDYAAQLRQMGRMGGMAGVMNLLPGMGQLKEALKDAPVGDGMLKRQEAIISSMTKAERRDVKLTECLPSPPHRPWIGHVGAGGKPSSEAVPANTGHDEENEEARQSGPDASRAESPDAGWRLWRASLTS